MQKINLFISYYQCGDKERQKELDYCYEANIDSGYFSQVINFSDRPRYNDFFEKTKDYSDDINILANADIYFNETINLTQGIGSKEAYALTRWEINDTGSIVNFNEMHAYNKGAHARHSQDVWVFNGAVKGINGFFHLGIPGCDNRIAHEIMMAGYTLTNPSDQIKCIHKHKNESRNYNIPEGYNERVPPPYKWVDVAEGVVRPKRGRI